MAGTILGLADRRDEPPLLQSEESGRNATAQDPVPAVLDSHQAPAVAKVDWPRCSNQSSRTDVAHEGGGLWEA